jgi:hypothetical protein
MDAMKEALKQHIMKAKGKMGQHHSNPDHEEMMKDIHDADGEAMHGQEGDKDQSDHAPTIDYKVKAKDNSEDASDETHDSSLHGDHDAPMEDGKAEKGKTPFDPPHVSSSIHDGQMDGEHTLTPDHIEVMQKLMHGNNNPHPGRGPISFDERANALMKEKMASIMNRKKNSSPR